MTITTSLAGHPLAGDISPTRRQLLLGTAGLLASQLPIPAWAAKNPEMANDFWLRPRTIHIKHLKGESLTAMYWSDGELIRPAYDELSWFMRDRVAQKGIFMDPTLLDIGYALSGWLRHFGIRDPLILTSAYRSPERNLKIEGAARNSMHTKGQAMDMRIPGVNSKQVSAFGLWLGGGGVGWYPSMNFTHLDRGRLRYWKG